MSKHDEQHATIMVKARAKHIGVTGDAAVAYDKVASTAAEKLAAAQEIHDKTVAEADKARRTADQQAHAELARQAKQALAAWTQAEREAQGVPEAAFIRRTHDGRFSVHAGPGVPAAAWAHSGGNNEWILEDGAGRAFIGGDELEMRRRLFAALMAPYAATEDGEAA